MCGQNTIFILCWPLFGPHRATFGTFWILKMSQNDQPGCPMCCYNLVPPPPTKNRPSGSICVGKTLFLAYFGPFLVSIGPHLGHSVSGKWVKWINLDVLSAISTPFQPVPLNRGPHMAIILKMSILALFDSNGAILKKEY